MDFPYRSHLPFPHSIHEPWSSCHGSSLLWRRPQDPYWPSEPGLRLPQESFLSKLLLVDQASSAYDPSEHDAPTPIPGHQLGSLRNWRGATRTGVISPAALGYLEVCFPCPSLCSKSSSLHQLFNWHKSPLTTCSCKLVAPIAGLRCFRPTWLHPTQSKMTTGLFEPKPYPCLMVETYSWLPMNFSILLQILSTNLRV